MRLMRARGQRWLNEFQQRTYDVLAGSNYYDAKHQMYEDEIAFATGTMLIYEDRETVINSQVPCAGEYFLGADGQNNRSVFNGEFTMTVRQLMSRFGPKALEGTNAGDLHAHSARA
jgi:Bacteriophage head to tail connecting protein